MCVYIYIYIKVGIKIRMTGVAVHLLNQTMRTAWMRPELPHPNTNCIQGIVWSIVQIMCTTSWPTVQPFNSANDLERPLLIPCHSGHHIPMPREKFQIYHFHCMHHSTSYHYEERHWDETTVILIITYGTQHNST